MVYGEFKIQDKGVIILREPRLSDIDDYVRLKNRLVEEDAPVDLISSFDRESEEQWLSGQIERMKRRKTYFIVAEYEGTLVGHSFINSRRGKSCHVAELGIMIDRDYRDMGLGSEMIRRLETLAQFNGIETIIIEVFKNNKRAIHLYSKLGYEQIGSLKNAIKQDDKYIDSLIIQKMITD